MHFENINQQNTTVIETSELDASLSKGAMKGTAGFKNLAAFHELLTRDGMCAPSLNSKFVNKDILSCMYTGKIFRLR